MAGEPAVVPCLQCGTRNRVPAVATGVPRCASCHRPLPWVTAATDATFGAVVEQAAVPVLVDLWAPWCGPCRSVSPVLESLAARYAGRVKLVKVNVDESPGLQRRFGAQSIPTLLVMRRDAVVARRTGAVPRPVLEGWLEAALAAPSPPG